MTNSYIQLNTCIPPYSSGNIVVNVAPTNIGAIVTIRDIGGDPVYFYDNSYSIIVSTTTGSFTDGTNIKTISIPYGSITLTAVSSNIWAPVFNEVITASSVQTISSLYVAINMYSYNYMNTVSTIVYGNISTNVGIEVNQQLMLGTSTTLTVSTMSNTFLNLSATSSYVSSIAFLSVMSNLGSISDPYISTTTLDTVFQNLGTSYRYISTAQMSKDIGVLSTLYISSLNQFNRQLTAPNGLIYNSNGVMTNNSSITVNKWYGVTTLTYPTILPYMLNIIDMICISNILYILTRTVLYSYDYTSTRTATPLYSIFTNAVAMAYTGTKLFVCDLNFVWMLTVSYSAPVGFSVTNPSAIHFYDVYIYVFFKLSGNTIGSINKYDATTGSLIGSIGKFLNREDKCVGFALGTITPSAGVSLSLIYIASQSQLYVYVLRSNQSYEVFNYTLYGQSSDGDLTSTKFNNVAFIQPYTTTICRTNSITSFRYDTIGTVYFTDGNRLRTLNFSQLSVNVTGVGNIDGFKVITRAGSGVSGTTDGTGTAASMDYTVTPSLALKISAAVVSDIFTYDNINQRFRFISPSYVVTTGFIFQVIGAAPLKIQDMTYDRNGNLYILTPFTLQQYNLTTQTSTPAFRQFYYISTLNITYDGENMLYIYDWLPNVSKVNVWGLDINTLDHILILSINSVSFAASLYNNSLYYFDSSNTLKGINVITGSPIVVPTFTSPRRVRSVVVTSSHMYICDISGSIFIYNTSATPVLLNNTRTLGTLDGYFDGPNVSYAFSRASSMKIDTTGLDQTGTIYFTDTNTVRKLIYNSTTNRGQVVTIAGNETVGFLDGDGDLATLTITKDNFAIYNGTIYITDRINDKLRIIAPLSGDDRLHTKFVSSGTTVVNGYSISNYIGFNTGMSLTSDIRLKESVMNLTSSLEKISRLEGVYYKKIGDEKERIGCIAQDVAIEYPEVVDMKTNGTLSIYYDQLTAPLVESIKELRSRVISLESRAISKNMGL